MSYQEIIQAIDSLSIEDRGSLLELIYQQQIPQSGRAANEQRQDEDVIHSVDCDGNPCDYQVKDLVWNPDSYNYIKNQSHSFDLHLSELVSKYAGKYIVFENGHVIDADDDEDVLLDRVCETDFYKQREAIYCEFVPDRLEINA